MGWWLSGVCFCSVCHRHVLLFYPSNMDARHKERRFLSFPSRKQALLLLWLCH